MYVAFVLIVLVADVYHRAVVLPRIRHDDEIRELERQLDAERDASERAGDLLNAIFEAKGGAGIGGSDGGESATKYDDRTCASAPPRIMGGGATTTALTAVLSALSNYGDVGVDDITDMSDGYDIQGAASAGDERHHHRRSRERSTVNGLGIESSIDGPKSCDRPIVLGGPGGILARKHHVRRPRPEWDGSGDAKVDEENGSHQHHSQSPYHFMMEAEDNIDADSAIGRYLRILCIKKGSFGYPAHNWMGAFHDGRQELMEHFRECWIDIMDDEESNRLERCLLVLEFPMTLFRKVCMFLVRTPYRNGDKLIPVHYIFSLL
jgi:hypothetical protein